MKTRLPGFLMVVPWLVGGCSESGGAGPARADLAVARPDFPTRASADLALPLAADMSVGPDLVPPPPASDLAMLMRCRNAGDCRLFASYCQTAPCECIPLLENAPDPVCGGPWVTCKADPCLNKVAACEPTTGTCLVQ